MMNFKHIANDTLLSQTKDLVLRERELTTQILWHLREIETRRLYAELGFASLYEYTVKELGYSEGSAARRIGAMRLLKEIPQVEEAFKEGTLTLSHLSSVQNFFRQERKLAGKTYTREEKLQLVKSLEGTSQRETEKILVSLSPEVVIKTQERIRPLTPTHSEFKAVISDNVLKKLERVKELSLHRAKSGGWAELIELMADQTIAALDPSLQKRKRSAPTAPELKEVKTPQSRYIPRALKQSVFEKAHGRCEFVETRNGKRCSAKSLLQIDHITPMALGGETTTENLRVLCATHNNFAAQQILGARKMQRYWQSSLF